MRRLGDLLKTRRSTVACDLGAAGVRAVQLQRTGLAARVCDVLQIGSDPSAGGGVTPALVRQVVDQAAFAGRDVTLVLSAPDVQFFPTRLPDAALCQPPERLEGALRWEVAQQSRKSAEELELRYWFLPRGVGQCPNVMVGIMSRATAFEWSAALAQAGLTLHCIEAAPCAQVRLALRTLRPGDDALWAVLDLGQRHSTLTVVVGRTPVYIRALSIGPREWVRIVADSFELPEPAAAELLHSGTLEAPTRGVRAAGAGACVLDTEEIGAAVASVLSGSIASLAREIERCLGYVLQSYPDTSVGQVLIAGGGARVGGLSAALGRALDCPVSLLSIPDVIRYDPARQTDMNAAAAAIGAALGDLEVA